MDAGRRMTAPLGPDLVGAFLELIASRSPREAAQLAVRQLEAGHRPDQVIRDLLAAAQQQVGERWQRAEWTVADEHQATAVTDAALHQLMAAAAPQPSGRGRLAVVCAEGDWHTLPSRMAAELLRLDGWDVTFIGRTQPTPDLLRWLGIAQLDGVVVTCSLPTFAPGVLSVAAAAAELGVPAVAGGRGMGPDGRRAAALGVGWTTDLNAVGAVLTGRAAPLDPLDLRQRIDAYTAATLSRPEIVSAAMTELRRIWPAMAALSPRQLTSTAEDLAHIVDYAATAALTADPRVFTDFLEWLVGVLAARGVPVGAVRLGLTALRAVSGGCPAVSDILRSCSSDELLALD